MVIQKTPTKIDKIVSLQIGQHQENVATQIKMDVSDWITVHPTAGFHILFKRPGEVQAQPVLSSLEEGILTWTVGIWETTLTGVGYLEVRAIEAESALVAKSRVIPCSVEDSIIEDGEVPPEFTGWVNTVLAAKDAVDETYADTLEAIGEIYEVTESASAGEVTLRVTTDIPANSEVLFAVISTGNANLTGNIDYTWLGASGGGNRHARITASNVFVHYHRQVVSTGVVSASVTLNVGGSGSVRFAVATGSKADQLMDDLRTRQTQVSASNAASSASAAETARFNAAASATAAATSAANAAASEANAEHYADLAQQGAEESGFVFFDVNDEDGHMYVTMTDNIARDVSFAINEQTGHLEVIYNE